MEIISLELKGYKRLMLNQISYIKLNPKNKIQIILGTNGSGKSSLLKELTPLPAIPNEFTENGFKIIEIKKDNNYYVLKSLFTSSGNKFHFIKNDEELNPGSTVTVFKELVKQEFKITQEIIDLFTGNIKFHDMSISDRRYWFTMLSDCDYTFAIKYYNKLKDQLRDLQGGIKLIQTRLTQETDKLLTEEEENNYRKDINTLNKYLNDLLNSKKPISNDINNYNNSITNSKVIIEESINKFLDIKRHYNPTFSPLCPVTLEDMYIDAKSTEKALEYKLKDISIKLIEDQKTLDTLMKSNVTSLEDIDRDIIELNEELDNLYRLQNLTLQFDNNEQAHQSLLSVYEELIDIFMNLEPNENKEYSRDVYNTLQIEIENCKKQIILLSDQLNIYIAKKASLDHNKEHNEINCPKCNYKWIKDYNEIDYNNLLNTIEHLQNSIDDYTIKQTQAEEKITKISEYFQIFKRYTHLTTTWKILQPLWDHLTLSSLIFNNPRQCITFIEKVNDNFKYLFKIDQTNKRIKEITEIKELLSKDQELNITSLKQQIENNTLLYNQYQSDIEKNKKIAIDIDNHISFMKNSLELDSLINSEILNQELNINNIVNIKYNEYINEIIRIVKLEISDMENTISKIDIQKALVNDLKNNLIKYEESLEVLKLCVKELSPTEGLIAEGLSSFINTFLDQLNYFIKQIWLYPLELMSVTNNSDEVDLDYKFELKVNDNDPVPDISKGSSAMKEVIDLSFKLTAMRYLGLQDYPIYLDEFGNTFDDAHRQSAIKNVYNLITDNNYSQIFLISHYQQSYGSIKNSDILVLCESNVNLPKDCIFNQHVLIK